MDKTYIRQLLKRFGFVKNSFHAIKDLSVTYDIPEIGDINIRPSKNNENKRINLLIPSVNKEHAFGGIITALVFFETLKDVLGYDARIVTVDAQVSQTSVLSKEYKLVNPADDNDEKFQLVSFADRYNKSIPVRKQDVFVATAWWTAYIVKNILVKQAELYSQKKKPFIYLIQDFEPGFYSWSSRFMLAESTYRQDASVWAVINSNELSEFLKNNNYIFQNQWVFNPVFNSKLKELLLLNDKKVVKKKRILIYGRPNTPRNAFEIIVEGLKKWAGKQKDVHKWEVYSAGESHGDINIGNGMTIKSVGKLTLEEYATILKETFAGVSLMVSPHPSYPPLEMSVFGIKTITNSYKNKNLQYFNENIINLEINTPECLAATLERLCNSFVSGAELLTDCQFVKQDNQFYSIAEDIKSKLIIG